MTSARRSTGCSKAACSHRFFRDFDWNNVETKQYCAAYIPFQKKPAYSWHPGHNKRQELAMCNSSTAGDMGSRSFLNNASLSESGQKNEADKRMGNGIDAESVYTGDQALFAKFNQILSI